MEREKTHLKCKDGLPIYTGDRFSVLRHQNECCNHWVICDVRRNAKCTSGFGLHDIVTDELIADAGIATYRRESNKHGQSKRT